MLPQSGRSPAGALLPVRELPRTTRPASGRVVAGQRGDQIREACTAQPRIRRHRLDLTVDSAHGEAIALLDQRNEREPIFRRRGAQPEADVGGASGDRRRDRGVGELLVRETPEHHGMDPASDRSRR